MLTGRRTEEIIAILPDWKEFVEDRLSNLLLTQDVDISASGTKLLAYYSTNPMAGEHMWSLKGLHDSLAKILSLWFNSTVYLLWTIINRVEVRGAWIKLHSYLLKESPIFDLKKLTESDKELLLRVFEDIKREDFPSILCQLKNRFSARVKLDKAILKVLGFNEDEINRILSYLYPALANEIERLKALMAGK